MRLNLGCGEFRAEGWVNVDLDADADRSPDVLASILDLPFPDGSAAAAYCGHVLEHLPIEDVTAALAEVRRVLAPGARLMVVGPDCRRAEALLAHGDISLATYNAMVHGEHRWPGDEHSWRCDESTLVRLLTEAGFREPRGVGIKNVEGTWPIVSRVNWQCAATGVAP